MVKKIMVVDDDVDYVVQLAAQLRAEGYEVLTADGVAAAKDMLSKHRPDLAIVDLMMENTDDGFRLCHHIKKVDTSIPVVLVTAVASETGLDFDASTREERSWIKADVVLDKPIRFEQLKREIHRLIHV
ncbi:MAG TPA: response regulator [Phycisphaerae bacterium]|nr:response regulator [Phycisphaerae bacterium]